LRASKSAMRLARNWRLGWRDASRLPHMACVSHEKVSRGENLGEDLEAEIDRWCEENTKGYWGSFAANCWAFELKEDAALFMTFWC